MNKRRSSKSQAAHSIMSEKNVTARVPGPRLLENKLGDAESL